MSALQLAYAAEKAWLSACQDPRAVLDRMAAYRDDLADARRHRNADAFALGEHLIELAEDRLAHLKAEVLRAKQDRVARPAMPPQPIPPQPGPPRPPPRPTPAPVRQDEGEAARRRLQDQREAQRRAERNAAERRVRAAPPGPVPNSEGGKRSPSAPPPIPWSHLRLPPLEPPLGPRSAAPRPKQSDSTVLPAPSEPAPAQKADLTPAASLGQALTGADLAAFRRRAGLTQVAAARRLGVAQGTISKAEGNPGAALGPALADALRRVEQ